MGSAISPIFSNDVMNDWIIETTFDSLNFGVPFLKRYVDDIIIAVVPVWLLVYSIHSTLNKKVLTLVLTCYYIEHLIM